MLLFKLVDTLSADQENRKSFIDSDIHICLSIFTWTNGI